MSSPNPEVIRWARESAGLGLAEAARKLGITSARVAPEEILKQYEDGEKEPSRTRLLAMAKQYHRSYITFFLKSPPRTEDKGEDFRMLPDSDLKESSGILDALVRDIYVRQDLVKEALIDTEEAEEIPFIYSGTHMPKINEACKEVKNYFSFDINAFRAKKSSHDAFSYLRDTVERKGVFVLLIGDLGSHHSKLRTEIFRGFALADPIAPFIVINDNDSKAAWSFTLLHELIHLWIGKTGISAQSYENKIEKYCNDVASNILISGREIQDIYERSDQNVDDLLSSIAQEMNVHNISGSLIAYRMYRSNLINKSTWFELQDSLKALWQKTKGKEQQGKNNTSGNYYNTKRHKVGPALINTVRHSINEGVLSETKAGKILGVSSCSVTEILGT